MLLESRGHMHIESIAGIMLLIFILINLHKFLRKTIVEVVFTSLVHPQSFMILLEGFVSLVVSRDII